MAVDAAIAGRLSKEDLNVLGRMVLAVMREDYSALVDAVIRAGWNTAPIDRPRFERAVIDIVEPVRSAQLDQLEFAPLVMKLFDMARHYQIEMPVQYILLMKTLVHIEGLGRSIYPQLDIWSTGRPLLEAWMLAEYGPSATLKNYRIACRNGPPSYPRCLICCATAWKACASCPTSRTAWKPASNRPCYATATSCLSAWRGWAVPAPPCGWQRPISAGPWPLAPCCW